METLTLVFLLVSWGIFAYVLAKKTRKMMGFFSLIMGICALALVTQDPGMTDTESAITLTVQAFVILISIVKIAVVDRGE